MMKKIFALSGLLALGMCAMAQYGTYDAAKAVKGTSLEMVVIQNESDNQLFKTIFSAAQQQWKATGVSFSSHDEFMNSGMQAEKIYLILNGVVDAKKHEQTFLSVVEGWKMKKNEALDYEDGLFMNVPSDHILASILIDPDKLRENNGGSALLYCKHLKNYLKTVSKGKVADETTVNRLYETRTPSIVKAKLLIEEGHLDKTISDLEGVKEYYSGEITVSDHEKIQNAAQAAEDVCVTDIVITGEGKTKHCFKRVFNASSGELLYMADEPALYGKKEGFLVDDFKSIARAR